MKKLAQWILVGAIAVTSVSAARADETVYITGATAYRSPAVSAMEAFLSGGFACLYGTKSGVTSEKNASNVALVGTSLAHPEVGTITIIAAWAGSVGGIKLIQSTNTFSVEQQPGAKGWITVAALGTVPAGTIFGGAETATAITGHDGVLYPFQTKTSVPPAPQPDAAFSDAFASSALGGSSGDQVALGTDADGKMGAILFDWVVQNGVTPSTVTGYTGVTYAAGSNTITYATKTGDVAAGDNIGRTIAGTGIPLGTTIAADDGVSTLTLAGGVLTTAANQGSPATTTLSSADTAEVTAITNITSIQGQQILIGGGRLSMFTGVAGDSTTGVYSYGRNADSGTRISWLGETFRGITQRPLADLQPTFTPAGSGSGKGGLPSLVVTGLAKWPAESVLGTFYTAGQSGYTGGGDLANALTSTGAQTVTPTGFPHPGYMIGYLGRSDSNTACAKTFGQNTAHRLFFNGNADFVGAAASSANTVTGTPTGGFADVNVENGNYQGWEFEHFYKRAAASAAATTVLNDMATSILGAAAPSGAISLGSMAVTKTVEGGAISSTAP